MHSFHVFHEKAIRLFSLLTRITSILIRKLVGYSSSGCSRNYRNFSFKIQDNKQSSGMESHTRDFAELKKQRFDDEGLQTTTSLDQVRAGTAGQFAVLFT